MSSVLSKKQLISLVILLGLIFVLPLSLLLTKQRQEVRKKAAGSGALQLILEKPAIACTTGTACVIPYTVKISNTSGTTAKEIRVAGVEFTVKQGTVNKIGDFTINPINCGFSLDAAAFADVSGDRIRMICYKTPGPAPNNPLTIAAGSEITLGTFTMTSVATATGTYIISSKGTSGGRANIPQNADPYTDLSNIDTQAAEDTLVISGVATNTPIPPTPTVTSPPQLRNACDQSCNTATNKCGFRNADGYCDGDGRSECCHRKCVANADCEMVYDGTNTIEDNECDYDNESHCKITCVNSGSCPGYTCPAKMKPIYGPYGGSGGGYCIESTNNPNCCAAQPTPTATTAVPTPTTTTAVPTPTTTSSPGNAELTVKVKFQGITSQKSNKQVRVILVQGTEKYRRQIVDMSAAADGVYSGTISNIAPGSYGLLVKGWAHLQKNCGTISLAEGTNVKDCTNTAQKPGDVTGVSSYTPDDGFYDNKIGVQDMTALLSGWTDFSAPVVDTNRKYDFNDDGFVNIVDATALLSSWCDFYCEGEDIPEITR